MALSTPVLLAQGGTGVTDDPAISAAFTPTAGATLIITVGTRRNTTVASSKPVLTGTGGLTFTEIEDVPYPGNAQSPRLSVFYAVVGASPVANQTITATSTNSGRIGIVVLQITGNSLAFANFASGTSTTGDPVVTLPVAPTSTVLAMMVSFTAASNIGGAPTGYTSLVAFLPSSDTSLSVGYDDTSPGITGTWSTANNVALGLLLEVAALPDIEISAIDPPLVLGSGGGNTTCITGTFTPIAGSVMMAFVAVRRGAVPALPTIVDSNGGTWVQLADKTHVAAAGTQVRLVSFTKSITDPTPPARTISAASTNATKMAIVVVQLTGIQENYSRFATAESEVGDPAATLALPPAATSAVITAFAGHPGVAAAPGAAFTEIFDAEPVPGDSLRIAIAYDLDDAAQTQTWTSTNVTGVSHLIELQTIASGVRSGFGVLSRSVALFGRGNAAAPLVGVPIHLGQGGGVATATTGPFIPANGSVVVVIVGGRRTTTAPDLPTVSDSLTPDLVWTAINGNTWDAGTGEIMRIRAFYTLIGTGQSMTVTGTVGNASSCGVMAVQLVDVSLDFSNSAIGGSATGDTFISLSKAIESGSGLLAATVMAGTSAITPPSGFTELSEFTAGTALRMETAYHATPPVAAVTWNNGYAARIPITLRARADAPSVTNFLLPFAEIREDFRHVDLEGQVESLDGWDIRFEQINGTKIPHKLIKYDPEDGLILATVNLAWNMATSLPAYIYVGKPGLVASEENATGARAGGWLALYAGSGVDQTGLGRTLVETQPPGGDIWFSPTLVDVAYTVVVMPTIPGNTDTNFPGLANRVYDGRDRHFTHSATAADDMINITAWPTKGAITGVRVSSSVPTTTAWRDLKANNILDSSAIRVVASGDVIVEGIAVYNIMDVCRMTPNGGRGTVKYTLRHVYGRYIRDDFIENDQCSEAVIEDCLGDGIYGFYSNRPGSGTCASPQKPVIVRRCVCEMLPMPYEASSEELNGNMWKLGSNMGPVTVSDCVFLVHKPPVGAQTVAPWRATGSYSFPATATFTNVTICWLGTATYGTFASNCVDNTVPAGITVITNRAPYDEARALWLAAHGSATGDDFPWLHAGTTTAITAVTNNPTITSADTVKDIDAIANDTVVPAGLALKVKAVRTVAGAGPTGSGAVVPTVINAGAAGGPNVHLARNSEPAGRTVKVQYQAGLASGGAANDPWGDINLTIQSATTNRSGLPWKSGWWGTATEAEFAAYRGRDMDFTMTFFGQNADFLHGGWTGPYNTWLNHGAINSVLTSAMTNNKGVCITMPLCNWTHRYNFNFIRTCASSAEIITTHVACAARIKSLIGSRTVHMRLGHECNASGRSGLKDANGDPKPDPNGSFYRYPWVFLNPADNSFANEVDYKGAWNRIASIYKASMGDQIQMVWNHILIHNAYLRVNRYWPGDDVVDVLSCDLYDSGEPEFMDNATTWNAWLGDYNPTLNGGSAKGLNGFVEFARLKGVKMAIDEWAPMNSAKNVTDGCNNNFFPGAMFNWLQANAADIAYESYYNLNSGGHQICPQATATYLTRSSAAYKAAWTP